MSEPFIEQPIQNHHKTSQTEILLGDYTKPEVVENGLEWDTLLLLMTVSYLSAQLASTLTSCPPRTEHQSNEDIRRQWQVEWRKGTTCQGDYLSGQIRPKLHIRVKWTFYLSWWLVLLNTSGGHQLSYCTRWMFANQQHSTASSNSLTQALTVESPD